MANPTTNFGWVMPTSASLVTNLPADFNTFGQAVDTSMAQLKGGTTGQILSKTSATDMAFTWVTTDDANAIQNAIVDAKGDLIAASAADTPARLAVGANDLVLTAASGQATGLKWSADWTSYTPTWAAYGTAVSLGNGSITGAYLQVGKVVIAQLRLVFGSTTTGGSGGWYFTLPVNARLVTGSPSGAGGGGYAEDAAVAGYTVPFFRIGSTGTNFEIFQSVTSAWTTSSPFTFGNGDFIQVQIIYGAI